MTSATHPMDFAKTLIQIGFEPVAPKQTRTWMGKPALSLPNVFLYMGHIRRRDGYLGMYLYLLVEQLLCIAKVQKYNGEPQASLVQ